MACIPIWSIRLQVSYRSYWTRAILEALRGNRHLMSVREISEETAIRTDDVVKTMDFLHLIRYWKGDHILCVGPKVIQEHLENLAHQKTIFIDTFRLAFPAPTQAATLQRNDGAVEAAVGIAKEVCERT